MYISIGSFECLSEMWVLSRWQQGSIYTELVLFQFHIVLSGWKGETNQQHKRTKFDHLNICPEELVEYSDLFPNCSRGAPKLEIVTESGWVVSLVVAPCLFPHRVCFLSANVDIGKRAWPVAKMEEGNRRSEIGFYRHVVWSDASSFMQCSI